MSERKPFVITIMPEDDIMHCWGPDLSKESLEHAEAAIRVASNMGYANWRILEPLCAALARLRKERPVSVEQKEKPSSPLDDDELRRYAADGTQCPRCHGEVHIQSMHERDSSNDVHRCTRCGWECGEMSLWRFRP